VRASARPGYAARPRLRQAARRGARPSLSARRRRLAPHARSAERRARARACRC
jgi:hypothetical protein